jgi:hypothetical protein
MKSEDSKGPRVPGKTQPEKSSLCSSLEPLTPQTLVPYFQYNSPSPVDTPANCRQGSKGVSPSLFGDLSFPGLRLTGSPFLRPFVLNDRARLPFCVCHRPSFLFVFAPPFPQFTVSPVHLSSLPPPQAGLYFVSPWLLTPRSGWKQGMDNQKVFQYIRLIIFLTISVDRLWKSRWNSPPVAVDQGFPADCLFSGQVAAETPAFLSRRPPLSWVLGEASARFHPGSGRDCRIPSRGEAKKPIGMEAQGVRRKMVCLVGEAPIEQSLFSARKRAHPPREAETIPFGH